MSMISSATSKALDMGGAKTDRAKLAATAKQFEALFVRQMLSAAARTSFAGEDDVFGSQAMGTFKQMQNEHFADLTAATGSLGLASVIEAQMARFLPAAAAGAGPSTSSGRAGVGGGSSSSPTPSQITPTPAQAELVEAPAQPSRNS